MRWRQIDEHPKWMISTMGRVKSLRGLRERVITPRVVNGRLFVDDRANGSFAVHLMVLETFRPEVTGDPIFIDGITGYLLTIADNLLRKHWHYSCRLVPISYVGSGNADVTNIDMAGYKYPSAELVAMAREV